MLARIQAAIHAPDSSRRLTHFIYAGILYRLPVSLRKRWYAGRQYYCPLCESHLKKFLALHRPYHRWCPVCRSLQRPRLGWLFLNSTVIGITQRPARVLHIAPEPALAARLAHLPNLDYLSADLYDRKAMIRMDITDIQYPDQSFELIYCSHVLEHVADDHRALSEFWRVLKPGGKAILMVPILGEITFEDPAITDPVERERAYGQHDHVRSYGRDFAQRVAGAGFDVSLHTPAAIVGKAEIERMGLPPDETIFLGQKPTLEQG
jgi:SAM-dependent methyltransferase